MIIIPCWLTGDATSNQLVNPPDGFCADRPRQVQGPCGRLGASENQPVSNVSRVSARLKPSFEMKSQLTFSLNKSGDQEGQAAEMDNANIGLINPAWLTQGVTFTSLFYLHWELSLSHGGMRSRHQSGFNTKSWSSMTGWFPSGHPTARNRVWLPSWTMWPIRSWWWMRWRRTKGVCDPWG